VDVICIVYLDDILIFSATEPDHLRDVREVLLRLRLWGLYCNPGKCELFVHSVAYLGFIVSTTGISMDPDRINAISQWPTPKAIVHVQEFLGFANYYRRFIEGYSSIVRPLTDMLKGSTDGKHFPSPFSWSEEAQKAFDYLRHAFTTAPVLAHFDPEKRTRVETDASTFAIAAILSQLNEESGAWHPIAFWSRKLISAETRYETHDQELLAIVAAFKHWRHYLSGAEHIVDVVTDHNNLVAFARVKQLNGRQARWAIKLSEFDFEITHRPGTSNTADQLSRRSDYAPKPGETEANLNELLPTLRHKLGRLRGGASAPAHDWALAEANLPLAERPLRLSVSTLTAKAYQGYSDPNQEWDASPEDSEDSGSDYSEGSDSEDTAKAALRDRLDVSTASWQTVPRKIARIAAATLHPVYGEQIPEVYSLDEDPHSRNGADLPMRRLLSELQQTDDFVKEKRKAIETKATRTRQSRDAIGAWHFNDIDDLLQHNNRIYVPNDKSLRAEIISRFHDGFLAGHLGSDRTVDLVQRHYHWPKMEVDIDRYVRTCTECQWSKARRHRPYGKLQSLPIPEGKFQDLSMDFIVDLPPVALRDGRVVNAILVVVDRF
jgi:hypothetical protein